MTKRFVYVSYKVQNCEVSERLGAEYCEVWMLFLPWTTVARWMVVGRWIGGREVHGDMPFACRAEIVRTKTVVVAGVVDLCCSWLGLCCKLTWRECVSVYCCRLNSDYIIITMLLYVVHCLIQGL
jgi:hypothetical protein